ncbi:MAG: glycosyltransferase family 1 protein [Flavobacterium sp.]|nr:MAG: glycosyltransferase family 1 protein [Flavobacterium sp.]
MKHKLIRITTVPISLEKLLGNQLSFMNNYYEVIAVSSDEMNLKKVGLTQGISTYTVEMTRKITPLHDLKAVWKLFLFLRKSKPLIVHTHTPKAGIVGMIAAKLAGVPHRLHTVAGLPLLEAVGKTRKLLDFVEKLTYSCATQIYPNSHGLYDIILNNKYTTPSKLKVLGNGSSNGIDTSHFDPNLFSEDQKNELRIRLGIKDEDFVFIFVGRLVADKGLTELVNAFDAISKENNQIKLLLVGPLESDLDPLPSKTEDVILNNDSIISVGYQNDVRPYFSIANVLTFPSYREGFPNVVMQAGSMGLPCIVTDINGCNEIISDGKNGLIIPVKNTEKLETAMRQTLDDLNFRNKLQSNSRKTILADYEQKIIWNALLNEYKNFENQ